MDGVTDVTSCIFNVPIFQALPSDGVTQLQRAMVHRRLQLGEVAARAGDVMEHLIVVHVGRLRLLRVSPSGREQVLRELGPGEFYGEIGLFADIVHEGDLVAAEDAEACVLGRAAVQDVLARWPNMALSLVRALAERLFLAEQAVGELALYDVGRRLAAELLRQAARSQGMTALGADVLLRGPVTFALSGSWAQMATKLGTTPESLSRRLGELQDAGVVQIVGRRVTIPQAEALQETLFLG